MGAAVNMVILLNGTLFIANINIVLGSSFDVTKATFCQN